MNIPVINNFRESLSFVFVWREVSNDGSERILADKITNNE